MSRWNDEREKKQHIHTLAAMTLCHGFCEGISMKTEICLTL